MWLAAWLPLVRNDERAQAPVGSTGSASSLRLAEMMKSSTMWGILLGTFAYNYFE